MISSFGLRTRRVASDVINVIMMHTKPRGALATWELLFEDMRLR